MVRVQGLMPESLGFRGVNPFGTRSVLRYQLIGAGALINQNQVLGVPHIYIYIYIIYIYI